MFLPLKPRQYVLHRELTARFEIVDLVHRSCHLSCCVWSIVMMRSHASLSPSLTNEISCVLRPVPCARFKRVESK